jgi:predicted secreted hydrolase
MQRRHLIALSLAGMLPTAWALPPAHMQLPRDLGSHPDFGTEWWYITGRATAGTREFGFQLTFFRSRVSATQAMASRFAAKQLLFAHAAITDVQGKKLWHDQRIARAGFGIAEASEEDTRVRLRDWSLQRTPDGYVAELPAQDFGLHLVLTATQPVLLQGANGLSRKGPQPAQASYYISQPQLQVSGQLALQGQRFDIQPADSRSWRSPQGMLSIFQPGDVQFSPLRHWTSPRGQTRYPVEWALRTPQGRYTVQAVLDDQELDSRQSTGAIYWEGLSRLLDAQGQLVGHGYLEMTGYASALRM